MADGLNLYFCDKLRFYPSLHLKVQTRVEPSSSSQKYKSRSRVWIPNKGWEQGTS